MRIPFENSVGSTGELHLGEVRRGDMVRFIADFHKVAPPVQRDVQGQVSYVGPETLRVLIPGSHQAGDPNASYREVEVPASAVIVCLHADDTRTAALLWEVEMAAREAVREGVELTNQQQVATSFRQRSAHSLARFVETQSPAKWQAFVREIEL